MKIVGRATKFMATGAVFSFSLGVLFFIDTIGLDKEMLIPIYSSSAIIFSLIMSVFIYTMEPMLMKTQEKQAVGRIKRIGQLSSSIKVIYLIYKNSIEENLRKQSSDWRPNVLNMISLLNS